MCKHLPQQRASFSMQAVERRVLLATVPAGFTETQLASGLTTPTAMDVAPDGRLFFVTQAGQVRVIENDQLLPTPFVDLSTQTDGAGERGMLGIALAPDFTTSRHVYVYYTAKAPFSHNRLSRLTADPTDPNRMLPGSEVPLLDLPSIGTAIWHMGGSTLPSAITSSRATRNRWAACSARSYA
jgi:glucose/arabinose dehydrogenase